jgi:hypothetical protein
MNLQPGVGRTAEVRPPLSLMMHIINGSTNTEVPMSIS